MLSQIGALAHVDPAAAKARIVALTARLHTRIAVARELDITFRQLSRILARLGIEEQTRRPGYEYSRGDSHRAARKK